MEDGTFDVRLNSEAFLLYVFEVIGTTFLVLAINFMNHDPLYVGLGIFMGIMVAGRKTGGHFNFGVTMGVYMMKRKWAENLKAVLIYFLAELSGVYLAMFIALGFLGEDGIQRFRPADMDYNWAYVLFIEFFFTFTFHSVIMHSKIDKVSLWDNMVLGALSVTTAIYFSIKCSGNFTGAVLNPTIGLGNLTFVAVVDESAEGLKFLPSYFFGPLLGGICAGVFCSLVSDRFVPEPEKPNSIINYQGQPQ